MKHKGQLFVAAFFTLSLFFLQIPEESKQELPPLPPVVEPSKTNPVVEPAVPSEGVALIKLDNESNTDVECSINNEKYIVKASSVEKVIVRPGFVVLKWGNSQLDQALQQGDIKSITVGKKSVVKQEPKVETPLVKMEVPIIIKQEPKIEIPKKVEEPLVKMEVPIIKVIPKKVEEPYIAPTAGRPYGKSSADYFRRDGTQKWNQWNQ